MKKTILQIAFGTAIALTSLSAYAAGPFNLNWFNQGTSPLTTQMNSANDFGISAYDPATGFVGFGHLYKNGSVNGVVTGKKLLILDADIMVHGKIYSSDGLTTAATVAQLQAVNDALLKRIAALEAKTANFVTK